MRLARTARGVRLVLIGLLAGFSWGTLVPALAATSHQKSVFRARDKVFPALVHIEPILDIFRAGRQRKQAVTGSGFIISADGYVVTNNHVVERAHRVTCTLSTREEVEATVIGADPLSDLAVIRIDPEALAGPLPAAKLGDSDSLEVGEIVMAMGSPLGLARSVSLGVVSSLDRYIPEGQLSSGVPTGRYNTWIQTDAAINPGNSGGPLVNLDGEVVGVNARAITVVGENLGFAIPINLAKDVVRQLIDRGNIDRSWIGVNWQELQPLARFLGVGPDRGAVVAHVEHDSPAEEAGLRPGDVVLSIGGRPLSARFEDDLPALEKIIADLPVDASLDLALIRDGRPLSKSIVTRKQPVLQPEEAECRAWGFTVQEITAELARNLQLQETRGVIVSGVRNESFAEDAGLQVGDVLRELEGDPVHAVDTFRQRCDDLTDERRPRILVEVRRGRVLNFYVLKPVYRDESQPAANVPRDGSGPGGGR
jgi:serine protease Do